MIFFVFLFVIWLTLGNLSNEPDSKQIMWVSKGHHKNDSAYFSTLGKLVTNDVIQPVERYGDSRESKNIYSITYGVCKHRYFK